MPILPLPQFEADLEADRAAHAQMAPPRTVVVRFGKMRLIGEFPYDGDVKPGCGTKLVCRTHRGTELAEMLTSTCPNGGCGHALTRRDMLQYFENSGGRDYPFFQDGRALRVATVEDLNRQSALAAREAELLREARREALRVGLTVKIADVELLLGGERIIVHFMSEERVDFRPLVMELAAIWKSRIEMHQVGARDEARITADYERCGQHCCCKQFLKVLKPVPMKNAKVQKATLDPLKISGRCGRLMCCLRYEESTYDDLRKNLPHKKSPVRTPSGTGIVIDTQILTQLVLVRLDASGEDVAFPVESIERLDPRKAPPPDADGDDAPDAPRPPSGPAGPSGPARGQPPRSGPRPGGPGNTGPGGGGRDGGTPGGPGGGRGREGQRDGERDRGRRGGPAHGRGGSPGGPRGGADGGSGPREGKGGARGDFGGSSGGGDISRGGASDTRRSRDDEPGHDDGGRNSPPPNGSGPNDRPGEG